MVFRMKEKTPGTRGKLVGVWFPLALYKDLVEYTKVEDAKISDVIRQMVTHCLKVARR